MALWAGSDGGGWDHFLEAMPVAVGERDMGWLAMTMNDRRLWNPNRRQMGKSGPYLHPINMPDAARKLCYTEYSTAYTWRWLVVRLSKASQRVRCIGLERLRNRGPHARIWKGRGSAAARSWRGIEGITTRLQRLSFQQGHTVITRYGFGSGRLGREVALTAPTGHRSNQVAVVGTT